MKGIVMSLESVHVLLLASALAGVEVERVVPARDDWPFVIILALIALLGAILLRFLSVVSSMVNKPSGPSNQDKTE